MKCRASFVDTMPRRFAAHCQVAQHGFALPHAIVAITLA